MMKEYFIEEKKTLEVLRDTIGMQFDVFSIEIFNEAELWKVLLRKYLSASRKTLGYSRGAQPFFQKVVSHHKKFKTNI